MIHPTAIVDENAKLHESVAVGPYSVIGPDVTIDEGTRVASHVVINGHTTIGKNNTIYQFASIGEVNQDKKYAGEPTQTIIGDNNVFRECCTVHRGTVQDDGITEIGSDNLVMCYTHIAHDVKIGNRVILANNTTLAGHVHIGDWAILGGFAMVHQFVHIGAHAFTAINSIVLKDIPPYVMVEGRPAAPRTINSEGLKRRGFSGDAILSIKRAFKSLYRKQLSLDKALELIAEESAVSPELNIISEFVENSTRGIIR
ncbi:MAG: acyl-ACP--UDP-N-acetylglucosamine O-acyltransferase [Gammaproteobacteria bacterium]|jgi:UDP-N-acetylglucosamine acyltransferase